MNNYSKLTWKQIQIIMDNTPAELKGKQVTIRTTLGLFIPAGANWAYVAGWTYDGFLVVTRFGEVR